MKLFLIIGVQSRKFPGLIFCATIITPGDTNPMDATAVACTLYNTRKNVGIHSAPAFPPHNPAGWSGLYVLYCIELYCIVFKYLYLCFPCSPREVNSFG